MTDACLKVVIVVDLCCVASCCLWLKQKSPLDQVSLQESSTIFLMVLVVNIDEIFVTLTDFLLTVLIANSFLDEAFYLLSLQIEYGQK